MGARPPLSTSAWAGASGYEAVPRGCPHGHRGTQLKATPRGAGRPMQALQLESRLLREIPTTSDMQVTPP